MTTEQTDFAYPEFFRAYVACALWSSHEYDENGESGDALDALYSIDDLSDAARQTMETECLDFIELCQGEGLDPFPQGKNQSGHDFWLTRNGHGAGYWDRGLEKLGDKLTEWAKSMGSSDLYVSDAGEIEVQ